jgi:hypothetical protein
MKSGENRIITFPAFERKRNLTFRITNKFEVLITSSPTLIRRHGILNVGSPSELGRL